MKQKQDIPILQHILTEKQQGHETRRKLFVDLEKELGMPVLSFFTSFYYPVMIRDDDADMIEGLLEKMDLSKGLALIINSPGGVGLSAERIINNCRSYSGTGEFIAIVPAKAKSAATMVCMGASKILMGKTSELGPIDPQITITKGDRKFNVALCNLVEKYNQLFNEAVNSKGNIQPYLQQLSEYDSREIKEFEAAIQLSEDVAVRALLSGMMKGQKKDDVKKKIDVFLTPKETKSHGRSIFHSEAKKCGLNIELMPHKSQIWKLSHELFMRTHNLTSGDMGVTKCIENKDFSFGARAATE